VRVDGFMVPVEELTALRDRHPNVLAVGPDTVTQAIITEITPFLRLPVTIVQVNERAELPLAQTGGTLVLRDVEELAWNEQRKLFDWIARTTGATQVVATSSAALLPLVRVGMFLDVLYYRLNTTYFETSDNGVLV
jgi:transcriptional regulator of acetoin/glycerol metabolism